jgi:hypothetical protein
LVSDDDVMFSRLNVVVVSVTVVVVIVVKLGGAFGARVGVSVVGT